MVILIKNIKKFIMNEEAETVSTFNTNKIVKNPQNCFYIQGLPIQKDLKLNRRRAKGHRGWGLEKERKEKNISAVVGMATSLKARRLQIVVIVVGLL